MGTARQSNANWENSGPVNWSPAQEVVLGAQAGQFVCWARP